MSKFTSRDNLSRRLDCAFDFTGIIRRHVPGWSARRRLFDQHFPTLG